jgi:hypothetical protein
MKLKQLSVFLENKPGALSAACRLLGDAAVNIQTFALADTQQFGILRLVVHEWEKGKQVLDRNGFVVKVTDVVAIEVDDRPGGLAGVLEVIEKAGVNVEYMYAFTIKHGLKGLLAFRFDNPDAAIPALQEKGVKVVDAKELLQRWQS